MKIGKNLQINRIINSLRSKTLDLTRRNPLISTKFSERLNSPIRIIGSVPLEELFGGVLKSKNQKIKIIPLLNSNDTENQDSARLLNTNETSNNSLFDYTPNSHGHSFDGTKNHKISIEYNLPHCNEQQQHGGGIRKDIQTHLSPDKLEKRLNTFLKKEKISKQETGISVLYAAFGFLEWKDGNNNSSKQLSPLVLISVQIEKNGQDFFICSDEGEVQENKILAKKLLSELKIKLPEYTDQKIKIEKYLQDVKKSIPKRYENNCEVKRWACVGIFPSPSLAMHEDLDPNKWNFESHSVVSRLFKGANPDTNCGLSDSNKHNSNGFELGNKDPCLIADADSSQFKVIRQIENGKNIAVEGPPGTGKSQTIVNAIAASLASGKKVLFVAQKSAALEVVRSRLKAFGIDDFLLPLQFSKNQVISSIKRRIEMPPCSDTDLDYEINKLKEAKKKLDSYVRTLSTNYGETNFTIHRIIGNNIKFNTLFSKFLKKIKRGISIPEMSGMTSSKLKDILSKCEYIKEIWANESSYHNYWNIAQLENINPFEADDLIELAEKISKLFGELNTYRLRLEPFRLPPTTSKEKLEKIENSIKNVPESISNEEIDSAERLRSPEDIKAIENYLDNIRSWKDRREEIKLILNSKINSNSVNDLSILQKLLIKYNLDSLKWEDLDSLIDEKKETLKHYERAKKEYDRSLRTLEVSSYLTVSDLIGASKMEEELEIGMKRKKELQFNGVEDLLNGGAKRAKALQKKTRK